MIGTGIVRRIDDLGRICIPKELRNYAGIIEGTPIEFYKINGKIVLVPYNYYQQTSSVGRQFLNMLDDIPEITKEDKDTIKGILKKIQ